MAAANGRPNPAPPKKIWLTLNGSQPVVIARGGFSGLFPDSSMDAYNFAQQNSLSSTLMFCDLQLTKDGIGFCLSNINLQNSTNIQDIFPEEGNTYNVNGIDTKGWFSIDFDSKDLLADKILLKQGILSRSPFFDGAKITAPMDLLSFKPPPRVWINVEYDLFLHQHKLDPAAFIAKGMGNLHPDYISSPEIGFLKSLQPTVQRGGPKLIFKILAADAVEATTKVDYGSLLKNLTGIKSFASGILVPKQYIWPVGKDGYLQPATSLVADAHKQGLEVYASGFANDNAISYNYSYDPTREYLQYIYNGQFTVDGFLTDFPPTASESIACLSQEKNSTRIQKTLIITNGGASGDYPGSTDIAYQTAIDDGADIIDCSVQLTKDGIAFCSESADLIATTTAASSFIEHSTSIPEIQKSNGIFSFDLTWSEVQSLKPQIAKPVPDNGLVRNPANKNKGKFVTLHDFLELAKAKAVGGILIIIDNAAYLASKKGLDIVGSVTSALNNSTLDKQPLKKILIQSGDSSVLSNFKNNTAYQRVLYIDREVGGVPNELAQEVKKYADAVRLHRNGIVLDYNDMFLTAKFSNIVPAMKAANISVYVGILKNEFTNFVFDYYSDPYVELATFVSAAVDGLVTEFPATANAYMRSPCTPTAKNLEYIILPVNAGDLYSYLSQLTGSAPAPAPDLPLIDTSDLVDPPLPPLSNDTTQDSGSPSTSPAPTPTSASSSITISTWTGFLIATSSLYLVLIRH
ncbi:hypothetical protein Leryth_010331 [Lithospermum erythrorhizon]|nr:hypothetical protein Leryth_010331 [Lithospermum erythrorhizon]